MAGRFASSIVRIVDERGRIAGAGFLASEKHVITCAHVVADTLGVAADSPEAPTAEVTLDFPLLAPGKNFAARVVVWHPVQAADAPSPPGGEDIAVLELSQPLPEGSRPARLVTSDDLWGHPFRTFGFPASYDRGVWALGVLRDRQSSGWVQVEDTRQTGYFVAQGFSGAPVLDEQTDGVVGMVVVAERRAEVRAAFIIPSDTLIKAWPPLGEQVIGACPYRGLFAFREEDAPYFFGRESFTERLVALVRNRALASVIGPSGSGKSSVVFAGLIPRLTAEGGWLTTSFRPGNHPLRALALALMPLLEPQMPEASRLHEAGRLADALANNRVALRDTMARAVQKYREARRLLLVIDQFEEAFTLCLDPEERKRFFDAFLPAVSNGENGSSPLALVLTMRADFLGHALSYRPLADALQDSDLKLGPMSREELQAAIELPARKSGVEIEDGLTERILESIEGQPGSLPLLEFALTQLWARQSKGKLTHAGYEEIGGVEKALADYAEEVFSTLSESEQSRVQMIFTQLVHPGENTADTRRMARRSEIGADNWELVTRLADARLVVTGRDDTTGEETAEIVHEALIGGWERLRGWVDADRKFLTWQERLRGAMKTWESSGKDEGVALRGAPLAEAEQWIAERGESLGGAERDFVKAGLAVRERDRRAREALNRRALMGLGAGLMVALTLAVVAGFQWFRAEQERGSAEGQKRTALSRQLAAQAGAFLDTRQDLSLLLSAAAFNTENTVEARGSLLNTLNTNPLLIAYLYANEGAVNAVVYSPDGKTIASAGADGTIRFWDPATRRVVGEPLKGHDGAVNDVAFSPDGKTLASAGKDGTIRLWDAVSRKSVGEPLKGHDGAVNSVAFSPDGKTLISGGDDGTLRLWDVASGSARMAPIKAHDQAIHAVAFSPNGTTVATGSEDKTAKLWNAQTGQQIGSTLTGHEDAVLSLVFSPDDKFLVTGGRDAKAYPWDPATGQRLASESPTDYGNGVRGLAFSADGKLAATADTDGGARVYDVVAGKQFGEPLRGHAGPANDVTISPDGRSMATAGGDGAIILWDLKDVRTLDDRPPRQRLTVRPAEQEVRTEGVAFSPDGKLVAAGNPDGVSLWEVATARRVASMTTGVESQSIQNSLSFSPDGKVLVSSSGNDSALYLWDMSSRKRSGDPGRGYPAVLSPDGKLLAIPGDNSIEFWDTTSKEKTTQLITTWESSVRDMAFSPDGKFFAATADEPTPRIWDLATRDARGAPLEGEGLTGNVHAVAFSPDNKLLATGGEDATILLWDTATHKRVGQPLVGHRASIRHIRFSPDGKTLASSAGEYGVILWDLATLQRIGQSLTDLWSSPEDIAFSPDSKKLAIVWGAPEGLQLWDVDPASWKERACEVAGRNFTEQEWTQFLGGECCRKICPQYP